MLGGGAENSVNSSDGVYCDGLSNGDFSEFIFYILKRTE